MQHAELIKCLSHVHSHSFRQKGFSMIPSDSILWTIKPESRSMWREQPTNMLQWPATVITAHGGLRPLWLCVPAFQQVCQTLLDLLVRSVQALSRRKRGRKNFRFDRTNEKRFADPVVSVFYHELSVKTRQVTRQNSEKWYKIWKNLKEISGILAFSCWFSMFLTRSGG